MPKIAASVARAYDFSSRDEKLTFYHHRLAMAAPAEDRQWWLEQALEGKDGKPWSANQLRCAIKQGKAFQRAREGADSAESRALDG